jgi:hypothetical protein
MKILSTTLCGAVALTFAAISTGPVTAAPLSVPMTITASSDVVTVDHRRDRFERRGSYAYYNGKRGYRDRRHGYRQHNGFWFPPAAFIARAMIGRGHDSRAGNVHVRWCTDRYRSYRAWDNSFQPYNGPRQRCNSPYG